MARRSRRPVRTATCTYHVLYRSEFEAQVKAAWHPAWSCAECRSGRIWHLWRCGDHYHAGHSSLRKMVG